MKEVSEKESRSNEPSKTGGRLRYTGPVIRSGRVIVHTTGPLGESEAGLLAPEAEKDRIPDATDTEVKNPVDGSTLENPEAGSVEDSEKRKRADRLMQWRLAAEKTIGLQASLAGLPTENGLVSEADAAWEAALLDVERLLGKEMVADMRRAIAEQKLGGR